MDRIKIIINELLPAVVNDESLIWKMFDVGF